MGTTFGTKALSKRIMTASKSIEVGGERILILNESMHLACDDDISGRDLTLEACPCLKAISVLSPISDSIHLIHGPLRCASFSWDARRCVSSGCTFYKNRFSTNIDEHDDISNSERKLAQTIRTLYAVHKPAAIFVYISCVIGKIDENIKAICKTAGKELRIPVRNRRLGEFLKNKELGYQLACNALLKLIGSKTYMPRSPYAVNILGVYNIAGGLWPVRSYFEEMGIEVVSTMTGDFESKGDSKGSPCWAQPGSLQQFYDNSGNGTQKKVRHTLPACELFGHWSDVFSS